MGSKEIKTIELQDGEKKNEKKRSQGNIALEDKKKRDNEELKRKKDSTNLNYDMDGKEQNLCNTPPHLQMIPSVQFPHNGRYYSRSGSTSQRNVSYAMPEKYILEFVLDVLQRSDPYELFAKPIIPHGVNKPCDFATIRAKIHMEHYMSIDAFKFDVYRLCYNAMYYNDKDSRHYQVGEALHSLANRIFEDINVHSLQQFHLESLPKKTPSKISQVRKLKSLGHARFRHTLPGGGRQHNSSVTIPKFRDKNVASSSKDIGAGACSSHKGVFSSQDLKHNASNSFSSQPNQYGKFQGLVSPPTIHFNQTSENELFHDKLCFSTFPINSYSELQMKLGQTYPMGPIPMLQHSMSSSSSCPITQRLFPSSSYVMKGYMNQSEGAVKVKGKEKDIERKNTKGGEIKELDLDLKL